MQMLDLSCRGDCFGFYCVNEWWQMPNIRERDNKLMFPWRRERREKKREKTGLVSKSHGQNKTKSMTGKRFVDAKEILVRTKLGEIVKHKQKDEKEKGEPRKK